MTCRQIKLRRVAGDRKWEPAPPPSERRGTRGGVRGEGKERRGTRYKKYLTHLTHYPHRPPFTHTENLPPAIHATYYWGWGGSRTGINNKITPLLPNILRTLMFVSILSFIHRQHHSSATARAHVLKTGKVTLWVLGGFV